MAALPPCLRRRQGGRPAIGGRTPLERGRIGLWPLCAARCRGRLAGRPPAGPQGTHPALRLGAAVHRFRRSARRRQCGGLRPDRRLLCARAG
ncbi:hypothetical protein G6F51_014648 [Rhizopus arrhizus]|uniref:Uncharacterized protein n=1 Tax=Rhizopus oryzae TaxID=64495 RepID=A0A9P7BY82_RHIOR|nr:hypothetical protein G6F51_014648 [Rhizopus arrhizus]